MNNFSVDIFTPSKVLERNLAAESLTIPTCRGEIQVLPEHTHLITKLEPGILTVKSKGRDRQFLVTQGICKILGKKIVILTKTSEKAENISEVEAKEMLAKYQQKLTAGTSLNDEEYERLQRRLVEAQVRVQLATHSAKKAQ